MHAATMYLEMWKRKQSVIAWEWDMADFESDEQTRPEFESKVKTSRVNPVTKKPEPYIPAWTKMKKVLFTNSFSILLVNALTNCWNFTSGRIYKTHVFLLMQLLVVLMVLAAIIIYRVTVLYAMSIIMGYGKAKMFILVTAGALQVIAIAVLNAVRSIVTWLKIRPNW